MESVAEHSPSTDSPDWSAIEEDVLCPLCEYNLRMLVEPRCPECGYRFDWPDMLDPTRRLHRYLFEHHPERNWWSFWKTALGGLQPRRFWSNLHAVQPSHPRRLVLYWILTSAVVLLCFSVQFIRASADVNSFIQQQRILLQVEPIPRGYRDWMEMLIEKHGSVEAVLDAEFPLPPSIRFFWTVARWEPFFRVFTPLLLVHLFWPWATVLSLLVFRWSMRRARIKPIHVLRCVLYSFDVGLWVGLAVLAATAATFGVYASATLTNATITGLIVFCLLLAVFATYRLWMAYRKYLGFEHALATVISSQVMVFLCVLWFLINWGLGMLG